MIEKTGFAYHGGVLHADSVALPDLAARYGTPSYIYSERHIRARVAQLQAAFAGALPDARQPLIAFACKANSNLAILRLMGSLGLGADIVSGGELARAVAAGIAADKIVFSGVGKTDGEIRAALTHGVGKINVESRPELERIAALAAEAGVIAPVSLRFNPDVDALTHAKIATGKSESKFGMARGEILELYGWAAAQPSLRPRGLSMHIGSSVGGLSPFAAAFPHFAAVAGEIRARGLPLDALDFGGGLNVPYQGEAPPDIGAYAALVIAAAGPLDVQIILEPGKLLVAEAGILLTRVLYVKNGETRRHLIVDAGMNDLIRPALYDAFHPIDPVIAAPGGATVAYDVVGPICETSDIFAAGRELPAMEQGDLIAIGVAGAYGASMASNYNTTPLAAEILVDGARHAAVRRRQDIADIFRDEAIPAWLDA